MKKQVIYREIVQFFQPLLAENGIVTQIVIEKLLSDSGISHQYDVQSNLKDSLQSLVEAVIAIKELLEEESAETEALEVFSSLGELSQSLTNLKEISFLEEEDTIFPWKPILAFLAARYFALYHPRIFWGLVFLGVLKGQEKEERYYTYELDFNKLFQFLRQPEQWIKTTYSWDADPKNFLWHTFITNLQSFLEKLNLMAYVSQDEHAAASPYVLKIPILFYKKGENVLESGTSIEYVSESNRDGLVVEIYGMGDFEKGLHFNGGWETTLSSSVTLESPFRIKVFPTEIFVDHSSSEKNLFFSFYFGKNTGDSKIILLGKKEESRLEVSSVGLETFVEIDQRTVLGCELSINNASLVIQPAEGDGFLKKLLPENGLSLGFEFGVGWTNVDSLYFSGSGGLSTTIPIHKSIGPITLGNCHLGIFLDQEVQSKVIAAVDLSANLGPVSASISRIGLQLGAKFGSGGNLGILDLSGPSFLPPTGAGLAIQAGVINGGGYLDFDPDNERYAGMLALKLGSFDLTAIGLITTRMPDGSKGFSLLVSIGVVFMPPIQLSYGFTLSGVGGLLGVNRRMVVEKIQDGLSEGSIDSIMFPVNVIENADRIISDLRAIFPPAEGQFVIAPFVKIGWGTPNIIQVDLGIFLEFPFKGRIILIGKLAAILPKPEKAILQLQVDVFGNFDFANERILILGALRDSYLYEYPLTGEFGFLLSWGQEKAFLLSAGGFHPRYQPPAGFPSLKPIRLDISKGKFHIAASCYHAITANSFQFGARAELLADYDSVKMRGVLSFDTFLQFQPFGFTADMGLKVDVRFKGHKLAGADMNLALSGPSPWVASGTATFSIWIWDKDVDFYESWGGEPTRAIEAIKAWEDRLKPALESNDSWGFYLPPGTTQLALLKPLTEAAAEHTIYLPPNASLEIRQQALPLEADLEQLGNAPIAGSNRFSISSISIGGVEVDIKNTEPVKEHFARGQFFKLSDSEKLSTPAFDPMKAGVRIKPPTPNIVGEATNYEPGYENILIGGNLLAERDDNGTATDRSNTQILRALHRKKWRNLSAGERMKQSLQAQVLGQKQVEKQADRSSVQADGERLATFETYTEAAQYVRAHSAEAGSFKIVRK